MIENPMYCKKGAKYPNKNEKRYYWNSFEDEVVFFDGKNKRDRIGLKFSSYMDLMNNVGAFNKLVLRLNKQDANITRLRRRLEQINGGYGHLTHRNGLTANEWVIQSQEKELKKKDEQISGWIEKYAENIVRIRDQQRMINELKEENEKLQKKNNDYEKQFRIINDKIDEYIKTADTYRIPISSLKYGDELGYFNGVYQCMKELKKDIGGIGYD